MHFSTEWIGDVLIVHVGEKHATLEAGADRFRGELGELLVTLEGRPLLLDMSQVIEVDSHMIQGLIIVREKAKGGPGHPACLFAFVGVSDELRKSLFHRGIVDEFTAYPSVVEAVVSLTAYDDPALSPLTKNV